MAATLEDALLELESAEIGISITSFPGVGWEVKLGDELNGFKATADFGRQDLHTVGQWILATAAKINDWGPVAQPEPEIVEAAGKSLMQPYVQKWPRVVSMEEWLALAHPDAPALPWIADDGRQICSLSISPIDVTHEILVELYDAHGLEAVHSGHRLAIEATALALGATTTDLTFLPLAVRARLTVVR